MKGSFLKVFVDGNYVLWIQKINVKLVYKSFKEKDKLRNVSSGVIKCYFKCIGESFYI